MFMDQVQLALAMSTLRWQEARYVTFGEAVAGVMSTVVRIGGSWLLVSFSSPPRAERLLSFRGGCLGGTLCA